MLLEGDDDESYKDIDEEEREHHKVDHIEDGHLHAVAAAWASVLLCHVYRMLQDPGGTKREGGKRWWVTVLALGGVPLFIVLDMSSLTFAIPPLIWGSHH